MNCTGSVKDRAAKQMVLDAIEQGILKPGMTIVEGTAGNTGIGLAMVAKELGFKMLVVMPEDQAKEKRDLVKLYGADLKLVPSVPFTDSDHFFHTAQRIAKQASDQYWHSNQFDNLSNFKAHYNITAPEIYNQLNGKVHVLVSAAGTGGTLAGNAKYLKEKLGEAVRTVLVDPAGAGLANFLKTGEFVKSDGSTLTEGVGIMRLVPVFAQGKDYVDEAFYLPDSHVVRIANHVRCVDGIPLGSSAALNVAAALRKSVGLRGQGKNIVTFLCDGGERSLTKLYNDEFLKERGLDECNLPSLDNLLELYEREESSGEAIINK